MEQFFTKELTKDNYRKATVCFVVNPATNYKELKDKYFKPFGEQAVAFKVLSGKASDIRSNLAQYRPLLLSNVRLFISSNASWFKSITKLKKHVPTTGTIYYVEEYNCHVCYIPDVHDIVFNVQLAEDASFVLKQARAFLAGTYAAPGDKPFEINILSSVPKIQEYLNEYLQRDVISCDIETFSLHHVKAGIASISFAKSKTSCFSFCVDFENDKESSRSLKSMLKAFFESYKGKLVFHNILFDATVLVYELFMENRYDYHGMYQGIDTILRDFDDTSLLRISA